MINFPAQGLWDLALHYSPNLMFLLSSATVLQTSWLLYCLLICQIFSFNIAWLTGSSLFSQVFSWLVNIFRLLKAPLSWRGPCWPLIRTAVLLSWLLFSFPTVHFSLSLIILDFPSSLNGKESACNAGDLGSVTQSRKTPLEKGMAAHSSILAWRIPSTEEPGGLQSMGFQE